MWRKRRTPESRTHFESRQFKNLAVQKNINVPCSQSRKTTVLERPAPTLAPVSSYTQDHTLQIPASLQSATSNLIIPAISSAKDFPSTGMEHGSIQISDRGAFKSFRGTIVPNQKFSTHNDAMANGVFNTPSYYNVATERQYVVGVYEGICQIKLYGEDYRSLFAKEWLTNIAIDACALSLLSKTSSHLVYVPCELVSATNIRYTTSFP